MKNRIIELRKTLDLTQEAFSKQINISRNFLCLVEKGVRNISDRTLIDICNTFDVNEEWLRDGTGDMFKPMDRTQEVARITKKLLTAPDDDFLYRVIRVLSNLTDEQIKTLKDIGEQFLNDQN